MLYSYKISLEASSQSQKEATVDDGASGGYCASYQESWFDNERSKVQRIANLDLTANNLAPFVACEMRKKKSTKIAKQRSIQAWIAAVEIPVAPKASLGVDGFLYDAPQNGLVSFSKAGGSVNALMKRIAALTEIGAGATRVAFCFLRGVILQ